MVAPETFLDGRRKQSPMLSLEQMYKILGFQEVLNADCAHKAPWSWLEMQKLLL
jgi:hypothetical protein